MSAMDELSHVAKHAMWVSCMASNVPVQITDPHTIERVASLLRPQGTSRVTASLPAPQLKPEAMRCPQQPERNTPLVARVPSDNNGGMPDER